jgi:tetratricopeptide (TPR) repeat protein
MDIFYSNQHDHNTDWAHLNTLLASTDSANVELGLTILENNPQATRHAAPALALISKFHAPPTNARAEVLLNSYLPVQQVALFMQPLRVFDPVAAAITAWQEYARRLQIFERSHHIYEDLILQNPNYVKWYLQIAKIAIIEYEQWGIGFRYAEKVLQHQPDSVEPRLFWIDAFVFHFFPKQLRLEQVAEVLAQIDLIDQKVRHIAPLAAYRRGLIFDTILPDHDRAAHEFERALAGGIQPPHKEKVQLALAKIYVAQAQYDKAAPLLENLQHSEGIDKIALLLALTAWKGFGNHAAAISLLKRAASRQPHNAQILQHLADLYRHIGDQKNANFYQQQALKYEM